jgi:DinB family protein/pentapeptide repeat protein
MTQFHREDLSGADFRNVDLTGARFRSVNLSGVVIRGAFVADAEISGEVVGLRVNGVEVAPLVEAELDRRDPDRAKMRPADADGFREAWAILEHRWQQTVDRARRATPAQLHERVDGEWSFVETLRHLVLATDAWVLRAVLGEPAPYHPLGLAHSELPADTPGVPHDPTARPALDEVLAVRADRMATVARVLEELTDERLDELTEPVLEPGYPASESFLVRRCLGAVVQEEWLHRGYAERDLAQLEERSGGGQPLGR